MGQALELTPEHQHDELRSQLASLHKRRDQLVAIRKQERTRLSEGDAAWQLNIERHIAWLSAEIAALERQCRDLIASNAKLDRLYHLLRSIPGIGPVTAATLIALLPELGCRSPKTIAALAGLAPFNVDSGLFRGQRMIRGGRKRVRDALYMAAVTAARSKSRFQTFLENLTNKGKPNKLALTGTQNPYCRQRRCQRPGRLPRLTTQLPGRASLARDDSLGQSTACSLLALTFGAS
jgi:transposase